MNVNISDLETIDRYIRGELNQNEIEKLWIRFLEVPELFNYFEIELHIRNMIRDVSMGRTTSPFKNNKK